MQHWIRRMVIVGIVIAMGMVLIPTAPQTAEAQYAWGSSIWVNSDTGSYLESVNPLGSVATIPLTYTPTDIEPALVMTSDNGRYILYSGYDETTSQPFLLFGETGDAPCCSYMEDLIFGAMAYDIAGFEPNGSRFAFSYVRNAEGSPSPFEGGIAIADLETRSLSVNMPIDDAMLGIGEEPGAMWAFMGDWTENGIEFTGNCYGCEGVIAGEYALWNPDANTFTPNSGVFFNAFGTTLDLTGELLLSEQDTRFDYDPSPGMFPTPNVIKYYPSGDFAGEDVVVYASDQLNVGRVVWVADGQGFLVAPRQASHWDVVSRDGTTQRLAIDPETELLGGTPEGWFALSPNADGSRTLNHFDFASMTPSVITTYGTDVTDVKLANSPRLGASITSFAFAPLPPSTTLATAQCPRFLPSRLVAGGQGRVTPGAANRMREYPDLNAEVVGEIPGEGVFSAIEGPICDEGNGIAWWRVNYNGLEGWTAEGQDDTYWTEPIG